MTLEKFSRFNCVMAAGVQKGWNQSKINQDETKSTFHVSLQQFKNVISWFAWHSITARLPSKVHRNSNKRHKSKTETNEIFWESKICNGWAEQWRRRSLSIAKNYNSVEWKSEKNDSVFIVGRARKMPKPVVLGRRKFFTFFVSRKT